MKRTEHCCPPDTSEPRKLSIRCEVRGEDEAPHVLAVDLERGDVVFDGPLDGFRYFARVIQAR